MDHEQNENNGFGCASHEETGVLESRVDAVNANGTAADMETCSSGLGSCLRTYKRRKNAKAVEDGLGSDESESQLGGKSRKNSCDQASQERSHGPRIAPGDCSLKHQRNVVLEQICHSLESDGGLIKCIQDALVFHPESGSRTSVKEFVHSCESGSKCTFPTGSVHDDHQNGVKGSVDMMSNGSNHDTFTELCQRTFFNIIMSEKFGQLCSLLLENGMKADKLFDLSLINSRMKDKAYESSPLLFHSDIQQSWTKLHKVGTDITAIAKCLSDKTMVSFREKVWSSVHSISEDCKHELGQDTTFLTKESNMHKADLTGSHALNQVHTCPQCREKSDVRNGLVCDSCEEMYHISCISPPVKEIPIKNWYCSICTSKGIKSPHEYCTACERLNTGSPQCTVCRTEVKNKEDYRICGNSLCSHKFYHVKCLTNRQLVSYGPCWYCPSCLCRNCLIDKDDDKIVLCDGCDHAYHIYCMKPPRSTVPRGKWFCTKCDDGVQRIRKAKLSYENMKGKMRKRSFDGKLKTGEGFNKSGGVDMLLNAAKSLNFEENVVLGGRL